MTSKKQLTALDIIRDTGYVTTENAQEISIILPDTINYWIGDKKLTLQAPEIVKAKLTEHVECVLSEIAGGFTLTQTQGGWVDTDNNCVIKENGTLYTAFVGEISASHAIALIKLANCVRDTLNQDSVFLKLDKHIVLVGWRKE